MSGGVSSIRGETITKKSFLRFGHVFKNSTILLFQKWRLVDFLTARLAITMPKRLCPILFSKILIRKYGVEIFFGGVRFKTGNGRRYFLANIRAIIPISKSPRLNSERYLNLKSQTTNRFGLRVFKPSDCAFPSPSSGSKPSYRSAFVVSP